MLHFEWDAQKAKTNERKHGVSFKEASETFDDDRGLEFYDEDHSHEEERWIRIGQSKGGKIAVVVYAWRERSAGPTARIISARRATRKERTAYLEQD